jgi:hypothetical protein
MKREDQLDYFAGGNCLYFFVPGSIVSQGSASSVNMSIVTSNKLGSSIVPTF